MTGCDHSSLRTTSGISQLPALLWTLLAVLLTASPANPAAPDHPWDALPEPAPHTDHGKLIEGPFSDGPAVTRACLRCHEGEAQEVMATAHWSWLGDEVPDPHGGAPLPIGKANVVNNFCIGVKPNLPRCTTCHAGYGWADDSFDFGAAERVDCLICHDTTGEYQKGLAGEVAEGVDLVKVARRVGLPSRKTCGTCHFSGGGGNGVKHGDLDGSLQFPPERVDVHMGRHDFSCQTCHRTEDHVIPGLSISVSAGHMRRVVCTDCHAERPHASQRLDDHTARVACQACHIPEMAPRWPTKMAWDWSAAGQDLPEDPHHYLKKKGSFEYGRGVAPEYAWFNGQTDRYLLGEPVNPEGVTHLTPPRGDLEDPAARIWPFKVHRARQPFDKEHGHLLVPRTWGEGGYWTEFDWEQANRIGAEIVGLPFSGNHGFTETTMHWPLSHMVQPKEAALQCADCHGEKGRLDWAALGYRGDPAARRVVTGADPAATALAVGFAPEDMSGLREALAPDLTGQVFSGEKLYRSAVNLQGRDELRRPWDVHAERLLSCRHCHQTGKEVGAEGHPAASTSRCEACHDFAAGHEWLPFGKQHDQALSCEACHVPRAYSPAVAVHDATVLSPSLEPRVEYRGVEGPADQTASLVTGFRPTLLPRPTADGSLELAPYNLVATWYWASGGEPVPPAVLQDVFFSGGSYHPGILTALDADGDGRLADGELRLDNAARVAAVRSRLVDAGIPEPRIEARLVPYAMPHGVGGRGWATRECDACHGAAGTLSAPTVVAGFLPGGVEPGLDPWPTSPAGPSPELSGALERSPAGGLLYQPSPQEAGLYLPGRDRWRLGEILGLLALGGAVLGITVHGGFRLLLWAHRRNGNQEDPW